MLIKYLNKSILSRLVQFTENNNTNNGEQFGFRKQHLTVHQIERFVKFITENKIYYRRTGIVFLDIENALDSVWDSAHTYQPSLFAKIVQNFLEERLFVVATNNFSWSAARISFISYIILYLCSTLQNVKESISSIVCK